MILPISHESMTVRRLPWVTIALIVVNFFAFVWTQRATTTQTAVANAVANKAVAYYRAHPEVTARPPLREILLRAGIAPRAGETYASPEQPEMDALNDSLRTAIDAFPLRRFGYVTASPSVFTLFSSQFMHAGWLHLLFNMWFLWLAGGALEDAWGRAWFPAFYLAAGVFAALTQHAFFPVSTLPLVGASGAIAGAMGAFLVKFAKTKIRFAWLWFRLSYFRAPAYLMLPLWLGMQLFAATGDDGGDGVAYWAHVGGFVFGSAVAIGLRLSGLDRALDAAIEKRLVVAEDPRLAEAAALIERGQPAEALQILDRIERRELNFEAVSVELERLRALLALADDAGAAEARARLIELYLHAGEDDAALVVFEELSTSPQDHVLRPELRLRVAQRIERRGQRERAATQYAKVHGGEADSDVAFRAMLAHALVAVKLGHKAEAMGLLLAAQSSGHPHAEWEGAIEAAFTDAEKLRDELVRL